MVRIVQEDLWKPPGHPGMIIVTANSFVRRDGRLVMGRGAAFQAVQRIPGIDLDCGKKIQEAAEANFVPHYGFLQIRPPKPEEGKVGFGILQVKEHWNKPANPDIILIACTRLQEFAEYHHDWHFRLNFPGIGEGGLKPNEVRPMLDLLPDNVTICHKGEWAEPAIPPGTSLKDIFLEVAGCLQKGQRQIAVEYLERMSFVDPEGQVDAVRKMMDEWREEGQASGEVKGKKHACSCRAEKPV